MSLNFDLMVVRSQKTQMFPTLTNGHKPFLTYKTLCKSQGHSVIVLPVLKLGFAKSDHLQWSRAEVDFVRNQPPSPETRTEGDACRGDRGFDPFTGRARGKEGRTLRTEPPIPCPSGEKVKPTASAGTLR